MTLIATQRSLWELVARLGPMVQYKEKAYTNLIRLFKRQEEVMNRRAFVKTLGAATAVLIGNSTATAISTSSSKVDEWPRPWGTSGHTHATQSKGIAASEVDVAWTSDYVGFMGGTPTVKDGLIYTGVQTDDRRLSGTVKAYDAETGDRVWTKNGPANKTDRHGNPVEYGNVSDAPAVENGLVYFIAGDVEEYTGDSVVGGVFALDAKTGNEAWRRDDLRASTFTVADDTVFITHKGYLIALGASAGETRWKTLDNVHVIGAVEETLYTYTVEGGTHARADKIIAYDTEYGTIQWQASIPDAISGSPRAVDEELIYVVGPKEREEGGPPEISALSTTDGFVQWTRRLSVREGTVEVSSPAVDDSRLYVFTRGDEHFNWYRHRDETLDAVGTVFALDRTTGEEQWRFETPAELAGVPVVDANTVYAAARYRTCPESPSGDINGGLYALDKTTGEEQWNIAPSGLLSVYPPAIGDGAVYQATDDVGQGEDAYLLAYTGSEHPPDCTRKFAGREKTRTVPTPDMEKSTTTTEPATTSTRTEREATKTTTTETSTSTQITTTTQSTTELSPTKSATTAGTPPNRSTATSETTVDDGQPGFGIRTALVGFVGTGLYLLRNRIDCEQ